MRGKHNMMKNGFAFSCGTIIHRYNYAIRLFYDVNKYLLVLFRCWYIYLCIRKYNNNRDLCIKYERNV